MNQQKIWNSLVIGLAIAGLILLIFSFVPLRLFPWTPWRTPSEHYDKGCHANMAVIAGAIDMYNYDHKPPIDVFDASIIDKLLSGGFLKGRGVLCPGGWKSRSSWPWLQNRLTCLSRNLLSPENPWIEYRRVPPGTYSGTGLSSGGRLTCSLHGDPDHPRTEGQ